LGRSAVAGTSVEIWRNVFYRDAAKPLGTGGKENGVVSKHSRFTVRNFGVPIFGTGLLGPVNRLNMARAKRASARIRTFIASDGDGRKKVKSRNYNAELRKVFARQGRHGDQIG
jgi:hypothetical protein